MEIKKMREEEKKNKEEEAKRKREEQERLKYFFFNFLIVLLLNFLMITEESQLLNHYCNLHLKEKIISKIRLFFIYLPYTLFKMITHLPFLIFHRVRWIFCIAEMCLFNPRKIASK